MEEEEEEERAGQSENERKQETETWGKEKTCSDWKQGPGKKLPQETRALMLVGDKPCPAQRTLLSGSRHLHQSVHRNAIGVQFHNVRMPHSSTLCGVLGHFFHRPQYVIFAFLSSERQKVIVTSCSLDLIPDIKS